LQALVNLKRPTLKLSPITLQPSEDPSEDPPNTESHNSHALEFEYDCDAPKCNITVQAIVSNQSSPSENLDRITVYESITDGGFGRQLTLEDGATIELGRFEHMAHGNPVADADKSPKVDKTVVTTEVTELPEHPTQPAATPSPSPENQENARKRRFTGLNFRRRTQNHSVSGPALAVLDNDATAAAVTEEGVRIAIRLVALDELGKELSSVNRQMTYLHVMRFGALGTDGEDNRPWVVKVVKREATASTRLSFMRTWGSLGKMCRLARIHSICMKFMASPLPLLQFTQLHPMLLRSPIRIHLLSRFLPRTNHRPSASYVSARHARSYFCHVVTLSRAKNAPSTWSNLAPVELSLMQRSLPRLKLSPRRRLKHLLSTAPRRQLWRQALPGMRRRFQRLQQGMMVQLTHPPLTRLWRLRSLSATALQKRLPHRL
jgi:hypothetical protein